MLWWLDQVGFVMCTCKPYKSVSSTKESQAQHRLQDTGYVLPSLLAEHMGCYCILACKTQGRIFHPSLQNTRDVISPLLASHREGFCYPSLQNAGDVVRPCLQHTGVLNLSLLAERWDQ